jgi:Integrase core domain
MADILHGSARTTPRVRAELQASKEKTSYLARQCGLSRTTVAKWRVRTTTSDARMGPRNPRSTVLTPVEEAMIVEFRHRTLVPLDDVLGCLRESMAFADLPRNRLGPTARWSMHVFDRVCREHGIEHRLTKPYHPWTNGQAERMNRTIKDATVKVFHSFRKFIEQGVIIGLGFIKSIVRHKSPLVGLRFSQRADPSRVT